VGLDFGGGTAPRAILMAGGEPPRHFLTGGLLTRSAEGALKTGILHQNPAGSVKNLGRYAASWIAWWPRRPSSTAALT